MWTLPFDNWSFLGKNEFLRLLLLLCVCVCICIMMFVFVGASLSKPHIDRDNGPHAGICCVCNYYSSCLSHLCSWDLCLFIYLRRRKFLSTCLIFKLILSTSATCVRWHSIQQQRYNNQQHRLLSSNWIYFYVRQPPGSDCDLHVDAERSYWIH